MWQHGSYLAPTQDSGIHSGVPSQTPSLVGRDQSNDDDDAAEDGLLFDMDHSTFTNSFTQNEVDGTLQLTNLIAKSNYFFTI
jgi:hypothetical protein